MIRYKTIMKRECDEQEIERSRFIAYVAPVTTKEEADAFITEIKSKHKDATHNVPAMVIGEKMQIQWASDDGEPQGTSGAPIVQMLVKEGITNVAIVVTRYFGGVKLGTGGLVRAYTSSAKLGILAAGICAVKEMAVLTTRLDYTYLAKLQSMARTNTKPQRGEGSQNVQSEENKSLAFEIADTRYDDAVTLDLVAEPESMDSLKELITNITAGTASFISEEEKLVKVEL